MFWDWEWEYGICGIRRERNWNSYQREWRREKIRDTKGIFQEKIGTIKDRNGMDLTEAEDIKKRSQEYTEDLYKKDHFMTQITMMV